VLDFSALPPEVISGLIHSGPGADSMVEASIAWQRLGTELQSTATTYASALAALTDTWGGPSALAMVQAAEPYLTWLRATAQQAHQTAASAQAASAAYDYVHSTVILPAQVTANRTRLAKLLATNMFGRNLPAIGETETQYQDMWANNSAAMSRYLTASTQATTLPQFSSAPSIVNPAGVTDQASAVTAAAAPAATSPLQTLLSAIPGFDPTTGWFGLVETYGNQFVAGGFPINLLSYTAQLSAAKALQSATGDTAEGLSEGEAALGSGAPGALGALGAAGLSAEPTAAIGVGVSLGNLTTPPAVVGMLAASHAPVQLASAVSPLPTEESALDGFMPPMMPPPISAGSGWRKRKRQKIGAYEDGDDEHDESEEAEEAPDSRHPAERLNLSSQDTPGSGWVKRGKDYDEIEYGAQLSGTVIKKPPSAG
jgi:PPE-repeat protein